MNNDVIEDDDIDLEWSFGVECDAPPKFRVRNHPIDVEDEENEDEDEDDNDDNAGSGGAFDSHDDINFKYLYDKWGLYWYEMNLRN